MAAAQQMPMAPVACGLLDRSVSWGFRELVSCSIALLEDMLISKDPNVNTGKKETCICVAMREYCRNAEL
jgi:hypothetical protein